MRIGSLLLGCVFFLLSPKHLLSAQVVSDTLRTGAAGAMETLLQAQRAFESGRPDYILAQRALEQAEATGDLRLQAKANLLQARLDSAGRRYSRALPYFNRAKELRLQADAQDVAKELKDIKLEAQKAEQARISAVEAKEETQAILEEERSSARVKYISLLTICMAILAAGALAFLAAVRKLRADISAARESQAESEAGFEKARVQIAQASKTSMKQLRRVVQSIAARIPEQATGSAPNLLAAHNASLGFLAQSSFEQGDKHEVAIEAFVQKLNPEILRLISTNPATSLKVNVMPVRLPVDQAVPLAMIYTELISMAIQHGGSQAKVEASITKEGSGVTLLVSNSYSQSYDDFPLSEGKKHIAFFVDEIGGKLESMDKDSLSVRFRFNSVANIATGTHGI